MAIICFANSRSEIGGRAAAAVANELLNEGFGAALYDCLERFALETHLQFPRDTSVRNPVCGRQFIEETRALARTHEHLVIDLSGAGDQIAAIAFAMADLVLIPFLPHQPDAAPFVRTIELLDILSSHRSQPLRRAVFLASHDSISPRVHLEISGQLIRRGLATFPVSFQDPPKQVVATGKARCIDHTEVAAESAASLLKADIARFSQYALNAALHPNHSTTRALAAS
ncbi:MULTISPECIES: ParA family protein [Rhizobium]|uniref:ParA family protein n=1 Tax=Rhizobium rhododendri TaxID=2506430 RepID=A0ABY8II40_9HYPH|nr:MULTISPECIES: ParA family protein [Rhizobium]MBZ5761003.1 hypothetical protein [Rhizobium sp. VS19-DR96]MBZ5767309.1 hypothetical protein [Rhizobium sp. VS19-DR129.2]MBZ5773402.1 hypothetical protein [Rhizobium sp. VS19-DRK62.2]MBZ5785621.1 hypothetical protein [Rhizobium sp. VS19-DR121]MBZ5805260.1 hypothetical protein [Rhizobium sp. VS19-DR181]